ncbi:alginate export family protein [Methylomagnum sp.]
MMTSYRKRWAAALAAGLLPAVAASAATGGAGGTPDYYVQNRSYRTVPDTDPPRYVRNLSKTGIEAFKDSHWLDVGLDHRIRYEYRENDFRRTPQQGHDDPVLLRTRVYLGLKEILDPFRFVVEFEDARAYNSHYTRDNRDVNEFELIQLYGELYFKDALGPGRPISVRGGRQAFELLDRRLIANNEFRNTTNNFQGFRVKLGQPRNDWELDLLALQPIERLKYEFDRPFEEQWFYGAVASWRGWSDIITLQPYYLGFKQDSNTGQTGQDQNIHSTGLRGYGIVGRTGLDYDFDVVYQFGRSNGGEQHSAWASATELGYTFEDVAWKPRVSAFYGYGSGDHNPNDNKNQRFNPLFGFNQPWSRNDYFSWDNLHAPKARLEFSPHKDVRVDTGYNAYWLASDTDGWQRANLRDKTGESGSFLGHEFDVRVRYQLNPRIATELSYAYFAAGEFPRNLGKNKDSNFIYLQVSFNAFE